jgi:hypothetical protein
MSEIKLLDDDVEYSSLRPIGWDVVLRDIPFNVYRIDGYNHSIGGKWGENCYWACAADEMPTKNNLVEFSGAPCRWGFEIQENNFLKTKWGETEMRVSHKCTIYRNGEEFYDFFGSTEYCAAKAVTFLVHLQEHPIAFNMRNFRDEILGRKIYWKEQPAIIERYIEGQACVIIRPENPNGFNKPCWMGKNDYMEDSFEVKEDIFSKSIWWFRD